MKHNQRMKVYIFQQCCQFICTSNSAQRYEIGNKIHSAVTGFVKNSKILIFQTCIDDSYVEKATKFITKIFVMHFVAFST